MPEPLIPLSLLDPVIRGLSDEQLRTALAALERQRRAQRPPPPPEIPPPLRARLQRN